VTATSAYPPLHGQYTSNRGTFNSLYSGIPAGTARDFREIAKIVYGVERNVANIGPHFFQLSKRRVRHALRPGRGRSAGTALPAPRRGRRPRSRCFATTSGTWARSSTAIRARSGRTTILLWSEFSRRVEQNDNGTDHGSQGPMFVIGGGVNGGCMGITQHQLVGAR
jgi:hypothetical protein